MNVDPAIVAEVNGTARRGHIADVILPKKCSNESVYCGCYSAEFGSNESAYCGCLMGPRAAGILRMLSCKKMQ